MEYKYYNYFCLSNELSKAISDIISKKEKDNYVCRIITVTTNEEYGYCEGKNVEKKHLFFVVMKSDELEAFSKLSFEDEIKIDIDKLIYQGLMENKNTKDLVKEILQPYCVICEDYLGAFDARTLIESFPYLQEFFSYLDEWRAKTGRVTVDDDILEKGKRKTLRIRK